jgi:hypothetical protein
MTRDRGVIVEAVKVGGKLLPTGGDRPLKLAQTKS